MYSTEIDGERVEFGTSGFLYRSNKLMYDRKTETLWHQFSGVPVVGPLVGSGMKLEILPMTLTTWSEWVAEHPDTTVLDVDTGVYPEGNYRPESANTSTYFAYRSQRGTMFPVPERSLDLATKDQVFGLVLGDVARAYPLSIFDGPTLINDTLGDHNVLVIAPVEGAGVRAYERGSHVFTVSDMATGPGRLVILTDEQGVDWQTEEDALVSLDGSGQTLGRLPSRNAYWFGWYAFYPHTSIYSP